MKFVGIDGEGYTKNDVHLYSLLANSEGDYIENYDGLRTVDCLEFLLGMQSNYPGSTFVSFFFSYDTNMIMRSLSWKGVKTLADTGQVRFMAESGFRYTVDFMPKKFTTIAKAKDGRTISRIKIYDVWGFFQSSFVKALKEHGLYESEIEDMKQQRGTFSKKDKERIRRYCLRECELLVQLMNKIQQSLELADIRINGYHGAGAVASAYLKRHNVKDLLYTPEDDRIRDAILGSYYGGHSQVWQIGEFPTLYNYDIVSAYPAALHKLPSFANATYTHYEGYKPAEYAIYRVAWDESPMPTLPVRTASARIQYPYSCNSGYYYGFEVQPILDELTVLESFVFEGYRPNAFAFVYDLFQERLKMKREGNPAQLAIKLGLNSLYGKLAQTVGFRGKQPTYQDMLLGGMITSYTRAKLQSIIRRHPSSVVACATDGILLTEPIDEPLNPDLGGLELEYYESGGYVFQSGIYVLNGKAKIKTRTRGFNSVDFDELIKRFNEVGVLANVTFPVNQFMTMKLASTRQKWLRWVKGEKVLNIMPTKSTVRMSSESPLQYEVIPADFIEESKLYDVKEAEQVRNEQYALDEV